MLAYAIVAICLSIGIYILFLRLFPGPVVRIVLRSRAGRGLVDVIAFFGTTAFVWALAGQSVFGMAVGALSGLIVSGLISVHSAIHRRTWTLGRDWFSPDLSKPREQDPFWRKAGRGGS